MVCAILINKVSVNCLPCLVHGVHQTVSVRLENIEVRQVSFSSLRLKCSAAFSTSLYQGTAGLTFTLCLKWGVTINDFGKGSVVSAYKSIQVTWSL